MYIDVTHLWRETVENIESRKDELGLVIPPKDKNRILGGTTLNVTRQAREIVSAIGKLCEMLDEHRIAYMSSQHTSPATAMSDAERDQVDIGAEEISKKCKSLITKFRNDIAKIDANSSCQEHLSGIATGLDSYLKTVISNHSEMRAVRVQRHLQHSKMSRLEVTSREKRSLELVDTPVKAPSSLALQEKAMEAAAQAARAMESSDEEEMTQEEAMQLEMENEALMEQLSSLTDSVQQVQHKVVKIAELQEIFTEKVLQQADDIDRVHAQAVAATENIKGGNEAVRTAIQNNASYRVYILFVLLVFSFALLFLDWYND